MFQFKAKFHLVLVFCERIDFFFFSGFYISCALSNNLLQDGVFFCFLILFSVSECTLFFVSWERSGKEGKGRDVVVGEDKKERGGIDWKVREG